MDIVYFSYNLWKSMRQRTHQITLELGKNNRVLFVEPPTNLFHYYTKKHMYNEERLTRIQDRELYVLKALPSLPMKNSVKAINHFHQVILHSYVSRAISELEFYEPVVWLTFPTQYYHLGKYGAEFNCYECMDEYSELEKKYNASLIGSYESALIPKVDLLITTAENLHINRSRYAKRALISRNAVEYDFFNQAIGSSIKPAAVFDNDRPVIGYIGAIREWLNIDLIRDMAIKRTDLNFLMVGPIGADINSLERLPNVRFTGMIDYNSLLPYLKLMDVTIIPFNLNKVIENTNPIKIYEYLAAGKPVVVSPFKEAVRLSGIVDVASNVEEFIEKIESNLRNDNDTLMVRRIKFAKENSWENRVKEIIREFNQILSKKNEA